MELPPKLRDGNKKLQATLSKALAKSTEVITFFLLSLLEINGISRETVP